MTDREIKAVRQRYERDGELGVSPNDLRYQLALRRASEDAGELADLNRDQIAFAGWQGRDADDAYDGGRALGWIAAMSAAWLVAITALELAH